MFKIKYLPTGNVFLLPKEEAKDLKTKFPYDYQILEKNGQKFKDKFPKKQEIEDKSILSKVLDTED